MFLLAVLVLPFAGSFIAALLRVNARNAEAWLAGAVALTAFCLIGAAYPNVTNGGVVGWRTDWVAELGLAFVLRLDGFAWAFAMLITGIGFLVVLYARYYMSPANPVSRFFSFLLAFMGAMLGIVLFSNLIQLTFFWELTSLFSFLLIGYWHQSAQARDGARMALIVTSAGGLCLLAGVLLVGHIVGSYDLDRVLASGDAIRAHSLYIPALVLVVLGALTKSAQFPFHFWLPNAMAAPTPVSAYLHSATMVKAGVFLLVRLWPAMGGTNEWLWLVASAGLITFILGAFLAVFQQDLKGLLAYSTISHLGLITLLTGLDTPFGQIAAIFHIINHATFKSSLFMAAGIIDHETGTRDIRRLSGLWAFMPITATLALVATAAMAGVPLLNGFLSKEMFFAETLSLKGSPFAVWTLPTLATLAGAGSVAYSLRFAIEVFFGPSTARDTPREPEEPPKWMRVPVEVLVLLCLVVGIFPAASVGPLLAAASRQVIGGDLPAYSLKLWHGFTPELLMSTLALLGGALLYLAVRRREMSASPLGGRVFIRLLAWLTLLSRSVRARLLTAGLQRQLLLLVLVTLLVGFSVAAGGIGTRNRPLIPLSPAFIALWAVGGVAAVASAWQAKFHRIAALMCAGSAGAICCVTFIWFSGPDLALTQLTVEVVTTLLMLLGLRWLPPREPERAIHDARTRTSATGRRTRDFIVAAAGGVAMALLSFAVMTRDFPERTSFYLEKALDEGGGTNVVNVMLVDFRGFDTFGEGIVLALVALTVYALLRRFRPAVEVMKLPAQQRVVPPDLATDLVNPRHAKDPAVGYLAVPAVLVRLMLPVSGMAAVFFFLRGHNAPGGGFVAGLIMSLGLLLQYIVSGTEWVEDRVRLLPRALIGAGILFAVATATAPIAFGYPLLTSGAFDLGGLHVGSVLFFDLGVFCIVLGSTLFILVALAHQSIRAHRASEDR